MGDLDLRRTGALQEFHRNERLAQGQLRMAAEAPSISQFAGLFELTENALQADLTKALRLQSKLIFAAHTGMYPR